MNHTNPTNMISIRSWVFFGSDSPNMPKINFHVIQRAGHAGYTIGTDTSLTQGPMPDKSIGKLCHKKCQTWDEAVAWSRFVASQSPYGGKTLPSVPPEAQIREVDPENYSRFYLDLLTA